MSRRVPTRVVVMSECAEVERVAKRETMVRRVVGRKVVSGVVMTVKDHLVVLNWKV